MVNETKINSGNAFIDNLFALENEKKNLKRRNGPFFQTTRVFLTQLLTLRWRMPHIYGFLDCLSFSHLLATSCRFQNIRLSLLKFGLNFRQNKSNFCNLDVLFSCCRANQYSKICCDFSKFLKTVRALRVDETKVTPRIFFIDNIFALENEKK